MSLTFIEQGLLLIRLLFCDKRKAIHTFRLKYFIMSSTTYWLVKYEVINLMDRGLMGVPRLMLIFNLICPGLNILGVRVKASLFSCMFKQEVFIKVHSKIVLAFTQTEFFLILLQIRVKQAMIVCSMGGQRFHIHEKFIPFFLQSAMGYV